MSIDRYDYKYFAQSFHKWRKEVSQHDGSGIEREKLQALGTAIWPHSYQKSDNDEEAMDHLSDYVYSNPQFSAFLMIPSDRIAFLASARWADQGFPSIVMGHKYAAALMATHVPAEISSITLPPWKAFCIEIPDNLLFILNSKSEEIPIKRVLVQYIGNFQDKSGIWQYVAFTNTDVTIWNHGVKSVQMAEGQFEKYEGVENEWADTIFSLPPNSIDDATNKLIGKLIINVCLAMSDPDNVKTRPENGSVGSISSNRGNFKNVRTYKLGKPISIDVRQAINDYMHGRSRSGGTPSVQTIVRGHWKPKLTSRIGRPVWIEPYIRGPEDAPVLIRSVRLGKS